MRFLFVKTDLGWPRYSGHDVHTYYMMKALAETGHDVALLTQFEPSETALAGLQLIDQTVMPAGSTSEVNLGSPSIEPGSRAPRYGKRWRQERFRSYWGVEKHHVRFTRVHAEAIEADAVVVVGMEVLPYLTEIRHQQRIWYAADEWVWHHLSLLEVSRPRTWSNVKSAIILGAYENSFSDVVDRAWVVSDADRRALRLMMPGTAIDTIPNGVDASAYSPTHDPVEPFSCAFWGNLSFIPNEQALAWFCQQVWPLVLKKHPQARLNIYGFRPSESVSQLKQQPGVDITSDVPDIRSAVSRQAVVVLPFQSGGGVKNKLLEAAAMSKPIICTPRACNGLNAAHELPFRIPGARPEAWVDALTSLWTDPVACEAIGTAARRWVMAHHSWDAAARSAVGAMSDDPA